MNKVDKVVNWVENLLRFAKENGGYFPINYYSYAIKKINENDKFIVELLGQLENRDFGAEFGKLTITVVVEDLVHDICYDFTPVDLSRKTGLFYL